MCRVLHSQSDFCWSSGNASRCESLVKRQTCFRFHQKAQHALWCLWWSGTTLHFERNLWRPDARCISCISRGMEASARTPIPCSAPFLPPSLASRESDFCTSGSLNTFYLGWVWKINRAPGRLHDGCLVSLISSSSNSPNIEWCWTQSFSLKTSRSRKML